MNRPNPAAGESELTHVDVARPTRERLLAWPAVRERVGISRTTAWRLQKTGDFPLPVVISPGRVGWREEDIHHWLGSLAIRRNPSAAPAARRPAQVPTERAVAPSVAGKRTKPGDRQLGFDF